MAVGVAMTIGLFVIGGEPAAGRSRSSELRAVGFCWGGRSRRAEARGRDL